MINLNNVDKLYANSHPSNRCVEAMGYSLKDFAKLYKSAKTNPKTNITVIKHVWGSWADYFLGKDGLLPKYEQTALGNTMWKWSKSDIGIKSTNPNRAAAGVNKPVDPLVAATFLAITYNIFIHTNSKANKPKNYKGEELGALDLVQCNTQVLDLMSEVKAYGINTAVIKAQINEVTPFNKTTESEVKSAKIMEIVGSFLEQTFAGVDDKVKKLNTLGSPSEVLHNIITFALYATRDMSKDIKFVTYKKSWSVIADAMCSALGEERVVENESCIYFWEPIYIFDHYDADVSKAQLSFCFDLIASSLEQKHLKRNDNVLTISDKEYTIKDESIFDMRGRRAQNIVYSPTQYLEAVETSNKEIKADEVHLAYNYSSFLFVLLNSVKALGSSRSADANYLSRAIENVLPFDSEDESGGVYKGLRKFYNLDTGKHYEWQGVLPINLSNLCFIELTEKVKGKDKPIDLVRTTKVSMARTCNALLEKYNLGVMHKGSLSYFNAQFIVFKFNDLPDDEKQSYLTYLIDKALGKGLIEGLRELFPELSLATGKNDSLLLDIVYKEFAVALFDKLSKITKRASLAIPKYAPGIDSQHEVQVIKNGVTYTYSINTGNSVVKNSAFMRFSTDNYNWDNNTWTEETPVNIVNAVYLPMASGIPGIAYRLLKHMPGFETASSWQDILMPMNIVSCECVVGDFECKTDEKFEKGSMDFTSAKTDFGGTTPVDGLQVSRNEVIFSFLYTNSDKEICRYSVVAPDDCIITELKWKSTPRGNRQIKLDYFIIDGIDGAIKLRGGTKALLQMPKTGLGCIYNHLTLNNGQRYDSEGNTVTAPTLTGYAPEERPVDLVILSDCDKAKDGKAWIIPDVISETLIHCNMHSVLKDFNVKYFGLEDPYHLVWLEALAAIGIYDTFLVWFIENFGRTFWLHNLDLPESCIMGLKEMFVNRTAPTDSPWIMSSVAELEENTGLTNHGFPNDATVVVSGYDLFNEIYVFYTDALGDHMWQRTYGFGGNSGRYLRLAYKPELCSIRQSCGFTGLIGSAARVLASGLGSIPSNNKLAETLFDTTAVMQKIALFRALVNNKPIVDTNGIELPKVNFWANGKVNSSAILSLIGTEENITKAKLGQLTLDDIVEQLSTVVINLGVVNLYVPVVHAQDKGFNPDSLGGLVCQLFSMVLAKYDDTAAKTTKFSEDWKGYNQMIRRIKDNLEIFTDLKRGEKVWKKMNQGRLSAHCKAMGAFSVPIDEVWVTVSKKKGSFYQYLVAAFKAIGHTSTINGQYVFMSRSPLPFLAKLKVRLIYANDFNLSLDSVENTANLRKEDLKFKAMSANPWQALVSAFTNNVNAGDYDGDDYCFTPVLQGEHEEFPLLTYDLIMETIKLRTGVGALDAEQGAYIPDHYVPKRWKKSQITNPTCIKTNCLVLLNRGYDLLNKYDLLNSQGIDTDNFSELSKKGFNKMMTAACIQQQENVGLAHGFATIAEATCAITRTCRDLLPEDSVAKDNSYWSNQDIALAINEVYEAGVLGGLSWSSFDLMAIFKEIYATSRSSSNGSIPQLMIESGLNVSRSKEITDIVYAAASAKNIEYDLGTVNPKLSDKANTDPEYNYGNADMFISVCAQLIHTIGRATFNAYTNKGKESPSLALVHYYLLFNPELRAKMAERSIVIRFLERFVTYVIPSHSKDVCKAIGISNNVIAPITLNISTDLSDITRPEIDAAKSSPNGYDLIADSRFSESCTLLDGRSIGEVFHNAIKGHVNANWKRNIHEMEELDFVYDTYIDIWAVWASQNVSLVLDLAHRSNGLTLTYNKEYVEYFNPAYALNAIILYWIESGVPTEVLDY